MLDNQEYRKAWKAKEKWYKDNGYYDKLISRDNPDSGIDSQEIEKLARERILNSTKSNSIS